MSVSLKSQARLKIAQRYSLALFRLAQKEQCLDAVGIDLAAILRLLLESLPFNQLINQSNMDPVQRKKILETVLADRVHPVTLKFIAFVNSKKRLNVLREICTGFADRLLAHKGIVPADIMVPYSVEDRQIDAICAKLKQRINKNIQPTILTDKKLLGGFKVRIQGLVFDYSIQRQLERFKKSILTT